ncbi:lysine exporter LysO family protein [Ferrimonas balearica]|uniref:lysine exporter LysO family protein n=1 Tax=Ferrimonas balearica TaxID=44012 RepID=UPI001C999E42|nr:lysine exporter LysO family protein [Ferrimonas balearica]MBY5992197.1 lysine exporter LysO family protein [Ferrimonas balearica]
MDTLVILSPLVLGYLIKLSHLPSLRLIDRALTALVYLILGLMGMGLGGLDNLAGEIGEIARLTGTLIGLTLVANLALLPLVDRRWPLSLGQEQGRVRTLAMVMESLQLAGVVLAGFMLGMLMPLPGHLIESWANAILMLLLLLIGIQLRASNMSLRQILLNPRGLAIAALVLGTSLLAGAATALLWQMPVHHGLALAAGTGWYSLSGALVSAKLGPALGSVAFLADLCRELIAIVLIPILMRRTPASAIGYGGATAMDFTLPVIQKSGGPQTVPIAIVSGFVLTLAGPILIPFFLSLGG